MTDYDDVVRVALAAIDADNARIVALFDAADAATFAAIDLESL